MSSQTQPPSQNDPFDTLFSLEDEYYNEGHALGVADGSRAGRIEGRVFGLEKGFEKFAAMGALAGRCAVWEARVPSSVTAAALTPESVAGKPVQQDCVAEGAATVALKSLPSNARLAKHLQTLYALTEPESLSTQNNEDSVSDFDDRFKRAEGKVKVIEKIIGESGVINLEQPVGSTSSTASTNDNAADRRQVRVKRDNVANTSSMEDFNIRGART